MTSNTTCPQCQESAISAVGKYFRGPARRFRCRKCGTELMVSAKGLVLLPLIVVPIILIRYFPTVGGVLLLLGFAAASWLHQTWVPLVSVHEDRGG